jgi:hypothetical protein
MSATIRRATNKTGLVLLESSVQVAEDGLVTVPARFLAPEAGLTANDFVLDSAWPMAVLPNGLPPIQAGPFLATRTIEKRSGLTYIDATYVSALNPVRIVTSTTSNVARFSGSELATFINGVATEGGILAFDYLANTQTKQYAIIGENIIVPAPQGTITQRFNIFSFLRSDRVTTKTIQVYSQTVEQVGRVKRISASAEPRIVQTGLYANLREFA